MEDALKIAIQKFKDLHSTEIKIKYLTRDYLVSSLGDVTYFYGKEKVSNREKIIILHYLVNSSVHDISKDVIAAPLIDFHDVPNGNMYNSVFEDRVYRPFLDLFGKDPAFFTKIAKSCNAEKIDFGDIAFRFTALPKVPINFILHQGDEEFPPACKVLFDSSISLYLHTEDIAIVCEDLVREFQKRSLQACPAKQSNL